MDIPRSTGGVTSTEAAAIAAVPPAGAPEMPERVQQLMWFPMGGRAPGHIGDVRDPITALHPERGGGSSFATR